MTSYRLVKSQNDYDRCIAKHGGESKAFANPTVIAERDNKLVGFISSYNFGADCAPSVIQADSVHILMKMFDAYDKILASRGQLFYIIHVNENDKTVIRMLDNWEGVIRNGGNNELLYYIRGINHG